MSPAESRIIGFVESVEHVLISIAVIISPWLADLVVAGLAVRNVQQILAWPLWLSIAVGAGLEGLGMATAGVALELRRYNATRQIDDPPAPVTLAWALVWMQFFGSVVLALLNTISGLVVWAIVAIPVLGGGGTLAQMLHDDHKKRLADQAERMAKTEHQEELAQRRAERLQRRQEVAATVAQPVATMDRRAAILDALRNDAHATPPEIAQRLGISRQAVAKRLETLQRQGAIVAANGDGWKVLA